MKIERGIGVCKGSKDTIGLMRRERIGLAGVSCSKERTVAARGAVGQRYFSKSKEMKEKKAQFAAR